MDGGKSGIYVWSGKMATKEEKLQSMKMAEEFLVKNKYPQWTKVIHITIYNPYRDERNLKCTEIH